MLIKKRGAQAVVAAAGALALCAGLSIQAMAAADEPDGNIYTDEQGSITIFKHENQPGPGEPVLGNPTGDEGDNLTSPAVAGVVFTLFPIVTEEGRTDLLPLAGKDAETNWKKLSALKAGDGAANLANACASATKASASTPGKPTLEGFSFGNGTDFEPTDQDGEATLDELNVGAYLLCETEAPAKVVSKAAPVLVTIPYPNDGRGNDSDDIWLYNVTIYPKNTVGGGITKTIAGQDSNLGLGSEAHFPVTVSVPTVARDDSFTEFFIEDPMTDDRWSEQGVVQDSVKIGETALAEGTDYRVTKDNGTIRVGFLTEGLKKLKQNAGKSVTVTFTGKLTRIGTSTTGEAAGVIKNEARYYMKTATQPNPPENPPTSPDVPPTGTTPPVHTNWGNAKLLKVDAANNVAGLSGATFEVYPATTPYPASESECAREIPEGAQAISVNGKTSFTSGDFGDVTIDGLFVSDSVNSPTDNGFRCYVLKETAAPAGYVLPSGNEALHAVAVKTGETAANEYDATIENTKSTVPQLPLTGGNGAVLLGAIGGALVLVGGGSYVVYRRRRAA